MSIRTCIGHAKTVFIEILFPPVCVGCSAYLPATCQSPLCEKCESSIPRNTTLQCPVCKARLSMNRRACNHGRQERVRFPYLLGAAANYDDKMTQHIIHLCKYQKVRALTDFFARMLIEYVDRLEPRPILLDTGPLVVPIPMHPKKERARGFNQAALIGKRFAKEKNFIFTEALVKTRHDGAQAKTKTRQERLERVHGAFAVVDPSVIQHKNIILIDDVSTSGATLSEAARTLKAAGARHILALTVAKA